jgi:hypothetical protein
MLPSIECNSDSASILSKFAQTHIALSINEIQNHKQRASPEMQQRSSLQAGILRNLFRSLSFASLT